jgi:hypothetical protein
MLASRAWITVSSTESLPIGIGLLTLVFTDKSRLPRWRYQHRQRLLPIVRWETPYLAWLQEKLRSPALDSYFALTANLGTHTFFMIVLPILFWCGHTSLGRGLVPANNHAVCSLIENLAWYIFLPLASSSVASSKTFVAFLVLCHPHCRGSPCRVRQL